MNSICKNSPFGRLRAAGLGLKFEGKSGPNNAITDVPGVTVGYNTIVRGDGLLKVGEGPVRTGVTAILPRPVERLCEPVFAGLFSLNGNGEMTGSHYIEETGKFALPITITNTHSCGLTRDATIRWAAAKFPNYFCEGFALPVAAETFDGFLNDINGFHVENSHVYDAINGATTGPVEEGSVGGGTGMKCFGFKAGSGTASRVVPYGAEQFNLGVFVQANFGSRKDLLIQGCPIGAGLTEPRMITNTKDINLSSIIVIIATDAPFLPHQLKRLARRATLGVGKTGGIARHGSGDLFLAFSTANEELNGGKEQCVKVARFIPDEDIDVFFEAVVHSVEEAILNSMIVNEDMAGRDGNFVPALPLDAVRKLLGVSP